MKNIILILCVISLFSCDYARQEAKESVVWNMSDSPSILSLKEKIKSISFIALDDGNPDALFKGIDKVLYADGRFYILDYMGTSSVFVFDEKGKFLFKVGDVGQGPGEYYKVTDFDVNNGCIYLLDSKRRSILSYDLDGRFLKQYGYLGKIEGVNDLIVTNDGNFLLGMDVEMNPKEQVLLVDSNFTIKETVLEFSEETTRNQLKIGCFRRCGKEIVYHYPVSDVFYMFDSEGHICETYNMLLSERMPLDVSKDYRNIAKERRSGKKLSYFNGTPLICNDLLVSTAFYNSNKAMVCADLDKRVYILKEYGSSSLSFSLSDFNFPVYLSEKQVVCQLDGNLYNYLDEDSKSIISQEHIDFLNDGGILLVVYQLND